MRFKIGQPSEARLPRGGLFIKTTYCFVSLAILIGIMSATAPVLSAAEIHDAVEAQDIAKVKKLLADDPNVVNARTERGSTPLHFAAALDDVEMAKLLLEKGADIHAVTEKGFTPLHWASSMNSENVMKLLIAQGASAAAKTDKGATPLQRAVDKKSEEAAQVLLTETPAAYTAPFLDTRYDEGKKALDSGEIDRAYEIFTKLLREDPGNEQINFGLGMACFARNDYPRARLAFERALQANSNNDRARLELARTYLAMQQFEAAQEQFQTVLARNPPDAVRQNIELYLQQIRKGIKRTLLSGRIDAAWFYDDNVNVGPDSTIIDIAPIIFGSQTLTTMNIDESSQPVSADGYFTSVTLSGAYDTGDLGKWALTGDMAYYQNWISEAPANESLYYQMASGLRHTGEKSMFMLPFKAGHITSGGNPLMNSYGVSPAYLCMSGEAAEWQWFTSGGFEIRDYDTLSDRNGYFASLGEAGKRFFGAARHNVSMGLSVSHDHPDATPYQYWAYAANFSAEMRLPWNSALYSRAGYTRTDYVEREAISPEKRTDTQNQFAVGVNKTLTPQWGMDVNYQITDNNSTFKLYEYNRNVATVSAFYAF